MYLASIEPFSRSNEARSLGSIAKRPLFHLTAASTSYTQDLLAGPVLARETSLLSAAPVIGSISLNRSDCVLQARHSRNSGHRALFQLRQASLQQGLFWNLLQGEKTSLEARHRTTDSNELRTIIEPRWKGLPSNLVLYCTRLSRS